MLKTVEKAFQVINLMVQEKKELGVTDISNKLDINNTTVYKILTTLSKYHYVSQNPENSKYKLGIKFIEVGNAVLDQIQLKEVAKPVMKRLVDKTGETSNLMIKDDLEGVYIDIVESSQSVRMVSSIGRRECLHCTGVGKAIMAFLPEEEIMRVIKEKGLPKIGPKTITDVDFLRDELEITRERGYSIDNEESEEGIRCVGVPIFSHQGDVIGAISVAGVAFRLSMEKIDEVAAYVVEAANEISKEMGYKKSMKVKSS